MKKKEIINKVGKELYIATDILDIQGGSLSEQYMSIDALISYLSNVKMYGATHLKFEGETEYDNHTNLEELIIQPITIEIESNLAFAERLVREGEAKRAREALQERVEKAELNRLKQKYEK